MSSPSSKTADRGPSSGTGPASCPERRGGLLRETNRSGALNGFVFAFLGLLWLQLFYACIYGWRYGEYYDYGWYVPPLFVLCLYRFRKSWRVMANPESPGVLSLFGCVGLFGVLAVARSINRADPAWTLPIWIQAGVVVAVSLWLVYKLGGFPVLWRSIPIWILACSAIPLPTAVEGAFIGRLTDWVITSTAWSLEVLGYSVIPIGDRLEVDGEMVHVTEGCSGIRSAQSFLMVSLFFGEWLRLRPGMRIALVLAGFLVAWVFNTLRATGLSIIRVEGGVVAFDEWHDTVGYLASIGGAALLYVLALVIDRMAGRRGRIRNIIVERGAG